VRDEVDEVIAELERLAAEHRRRGRELFYEVRDGRFNPWRRTIVGGGGRHRYPPALAAMLIYLNRTGYNGLYRLNSRGDFNVPAGRYASPRVCDAENLRRVSHALGRRGVSIMTGGFEAALADAGPGDFVYVDPPYAPVSATARFTAYTAGGFGPDDQARLRDLVVGLARRGAAVLLSNSTAPAIEALYVDHRPARAAGLRAFTVPARRAINSRAAARGPVLEYLITNLAPGPAGRRETGERV
jgi:DNA adenine methylase